MTTENKKALADCITVIGNAGNLAEIIADDIELSCENAYQMMRCLTAMAVSVTNVTEEAREILGAELCGREYEPDTNFIRETQKYIDKWGDCYDKWDNNYIFPYPAKNPNDPCDDESPTKIGFYEREIERIAGQLASIKAGIEPGECTTEQLEDALDNEYNDLFAEYCDLFRAKFGELPPAEQARIAHNHRVNEARTDAKAVENLTEMIRDAAETLEIALFGDFDKMTDKEKAAALEDIHSSLMAELYGGGVDPDKVAAAEKEQARRKAERADESNLPFM